MKVEPTEHFINWQQDPQANYLARLVFPKPTTFFRVEVDLVAEMAVFNPFDFFLEPSAEKFPFAYEPELLVELAPYLRKAPATPLFSPYLDRVDRSEKSTSTFLIELNQGLQKDIAYLIRMEHGVQTPELTLQNASGSCRDSAWLLVQLLRHLGLAARFVSGYLIQLKSDVKSLDGPSGTEVDFTDLHAWCEVYLPGAGWIGLDPTSGLYAGEGHIPLACSPEPSSAAPISGTLDPCETTFEHHMSVRRVWEAPRVTLPYSELQWGAIDELGKQVDADLRRMDVRLTQGGEPTFVSVDDREGGEWNTEAMGPTKRALSGELMERLRTHYGSGGLVHYGQGKWYPGEQLPRWSLNLFWRRDGVPIWHDPALLASERDDHGATAAQGARVPAPPRAAPRRRSPQRLRRLRGPRLLPLARRQAADQRRADRFAPRRQGRAQPPAPGVRARPRRAGRLRAADRRRRARIRSAGARRPGTCATTTASWSPAIRRSAFACRSIRCRGRAPATSRGSIRPTPTSSCRRLPATATRRRRATRPAWHASGESAGAEVGRARDAERHARRRRRRPPRRRRRATRRRSDESAGFVVRTAISAEARHGRLYIFMPPTSALEDYLALVAAVEATAQGDAPAGDARRLRAADAIRASSCCASRRTRA